MPAIPFLLIICYKLPFAINPCYAILPIWEKTKQKKTGANLRSLANLTMTLESFFRIYLITLSLYLFENQDHSKFILMY